MQDDFDFEQLTNDSCLLKWENKVRITILIVQFDDDFVVGV